MVELKVRFGSSLGVCRTRSPLFLIEGPDGTYRLVPYDPGFEKKIKGR